MASNTGFGGWAGKQGAASFPLHAATIVPKLGTSNVIVTAYPDIGPWGGDRCWSSWGTPPADSKRSRGGAIVKRPFQPILRLSVGVALAGCAQSVVPQVRQMDDGSCMVDCGAERSCRTEVPGAATCHAESAKPAPRRCTVVCGSGERCSQSKRGAFCAAHCVSDRDCASGRCNCLGDVCATHLPVGVCLGE